MTMHFHIHWILPVVISLLVALPKNRLHQYNLNFLYLFIDPYVLMTHIKQQSNNYITITL